MLLFDFTKVEEIPTDARQGVLCLLDTRYCPSSLSTVTPHSPKTVHHKTMPVIAEGVEFTHVAREWCGLIP